VRGAAGLLGGGRLRGGAQPRRRLLAAIDGKPPTPFAFKALGILASLGSRSAVAEVFGVQLTGFIAWFMWRTIYLGKLPGLARKVRVALDWTLDLFFARDITQLQVFHDDPMAVQHFEKGETIVQAGQIGREFFIILAGEVEVIDDDGTFLATLRKREVFGEKALLNDVRRTATVRASTPVDLLVMSRSDFRSMVKSFPVLDDYFTQLLADRIERPPELASSK
jgi:NADH:ubiquinone reductase (H+-translocating)